MSEGSKAYEGHAILELMGHRRLGGHISEVTMYGGVFCRIDIPGPDGKTISTQFYGDKAIYCVSPCGEKEAMAVALANQPTPVTRYEVDRAAPAIDYGQRGDGDCFDDEEPPNFGTTESLQEGDDVLPVAEVAVPNPQPQTKKTAEERAEQLYGSAAGELPAGASEFMDRFLINCPADKEKEQRIYALTLYAFFIEYLESISDCTSQLQEEDYNWCQDQRMKYVPF
jgi:hypothetical protein